MIEDNDVHRLIVLHYGIAEQYRALVTTCAIIRNSMRHSPDTQVKLPYDVATKATRGLHMWGHHPISPRNNYAGYALWRKTALAWGRKYRKVTKQLAEATTK